jgi:hypothetical protein
MSLREGATGPGLQVALEAQPDERMSRAIEIAGIQGVLGTRAREYAVSATVEDA